MSGTGFGGAAWGGSGWGSPVVELPQLVSAVAVAENVVQLSFSQPVYFSGLLDGPDASSRKRYTFAPVPGSVGMDGTAAKPVGAASVALVRVPGQLLGTTVNVTTDRPMTPNPAQYVVSCDGLFGTDGVTPLAVTTATFTSVFRVIQPPQVETLTPRGDVAMPQSQEAVLTGVVGDPASITLGSFAVSGGDYATQAGIVEYKERLYRRMVTVRDAFLHLAGKGYGASLLTYGKRLGTASRRAALQGSIEQQAGLEPETTAVSCKTVLSRQNPGLLYLVLLAKTTFGKPVKVVAPVTSST